MNIDDPFESEISKKKRQKKFQRGHVTSLK